MAGVQVGHRGGLPGELQPLYGVLPHRLQQPEAGLAGNGRLTRDQRLVEERLENQHHVVRLPADGLHRLEGEAAGEHCQPGEQVLLLGLEQVVAPVERGRHRPLAVRQVAQPTSHGVPGEPGEQRGGRQQPARRRSELQGQGEPVEASADLRKGRGALPCQLDRGPGGAGPIQEQRDRR